LEGKLEFRGYYYMFDSYERELYSVPYANRFSGIYCTYKFTVNSCPLNQSPNVHIIGVSRDLLFRG
jgi:hypothetical protein